MPGTGYLDPNKGERTFLQPSPIVQADLTTAKSWAQVAKTGDELAYEGFRAAAKEQHDQQTAYLAQLDLADRAKQIELRDKFSHDPEGFQNAWQAHVSGTMGETPAWAVPHRQANLGKEGLGAYSSILSEKRARDWQNAGEAFTARLGMESDDGLNIAYGKGAKTPEFEASATRMRSILNHEVTTGRIPKELADARFEKFLQDAEKSALKGRMDRDPDFARQIYEQRTGVPGGTGRGAGASVGGSLASRISAAEYRPGGPEKNPNSSATGPGQFIESTWLDLVSRNAPELVAGKSRAEILALRSDKDLSLRMIDAYAAENKTFLSQRGLPTDDGALYLAHFLGPAGAADVLKASPGTPAKDLVAADAYAANRQVIGGKTAGGLREWAVQKVGATAPADGATQTKAPSGDDPLRGVPYGRRQELEAYAEAKVKDVDAARARADAEQKQADAAANARIFSDALISTRRGQLGSEQIEDLYTASKITPEQRSQLHNIRDEFTKKEGEQAARITLVENARMGTVHLDPNSTDHKKAVDTAYQSYAANIPQEQRGDFLTTFVSQVGIIPPSVVANIRGTLTSGTVEEKASAANLVGRLQERNPAIVQSLDRETAALAQSINDNIDAGAKPEAAVLRAEDAIYKATEPEREVRKKRYKEQKYEDGNLNHLHGSTWLSRWVNTKPDDAMLGEYNRAVEQLFAATGSIDVARKVAEKEIASRWAVTSVGGASRWQKNAPEALYGVPNQPNDWIEEQLLNDLVSGSMWDPEKVLKGRVRLDVDPISARSERPAYLVQRQDENGVWTHVADEQGRPMRWRPNWPESPAAQRLSAQAKAERERRVNPASEPNLAGPASVDRDRAAELAAELEGRPYPKTIFGPQTESGQTNLGDLPPDEVRNVLAQAGWEGLPDVEAHPAVYAEIKRVVTSSGIMALGADPRVLSYNPNLSMQHGFPMGAAYFPKDDRIEIQRDREEGPLPSDVAHEFAHRGLFKLFSSEKVRHAEDAALPGWRRSAWDDLQRVMGSQTLHEALVVFLEHRAARKDPDPDTLEQYPAIGTDTLREMADRIERLAGVAGSERTKGGPR